ncbi:thiamine biosynthesis lipoprotein [Xylanibacter ruminicola]|uniref:FAD:protein FMN transferase n=1 Tax=Xylanibacter ruminicola TaxID=839 RepID=A0A1H5URG9_XYLRU|nr:FAD:protein FMN transferase [Xylanibacter ruminicola]SEF76807.1 thiamine biosynthesis lipoprotein [Xylanibacter ruminicola]
MKNKKLLWQLPFLTFLIVATFLIIHQQRSVPYQKSTDFIFGTTFHITYQCDSDLTPYIKAELMKVDNSLSPFNKSSIITAINQNKDVMPDSMFMDVFQLAMNISADTDGAFDITVAPLVNAWGFGFKSGQHPTKQQVDSLMQLVGYQKLAIVDGYVKKRDPRMMLDCSAIAKGYGSDVVAKLFRDRGIKNFMVEIGGEIVTSGVNEKKQPWSVGVTKPTDDSLNISHELQTILNVTDKAMATSGNYRNFYYKDGKKFAHTVDPKTGYPVQHSILSATVLAKSCAMADAYATSFMVMGLEKAQQVLDRHPELMAYFIYSDQNGHDAVWFSPSLRDKIAK